MCRCAQVCVDVPRCLQVCSGVLSARHEEPRPFHMSYPRLQRPSSRVGGLPRPHGRLLRMGEGTFPFLAICPVLSGLGAVLEGPGKDVPTLPSGGCLLVAASQELGNSRFLSRVHLQAPDTRGSPRPRGRRLLRGCSPSGSLPEPPAVRQASHRSTLGSAAFPRFPAVGRATGAVGEIQGLGPGNFQPGEGDGRWARSGFQEVTSALGEGEWPQVAASHRPHGKDI